MIFLDETIEAMEMRNKTIQDIDYINMPEDFNVNESDYNLEYTTVFDFEKFKALAEKIGDYDEGYGSAVIPIKIQIIFKDGSWLSRGEYDGSEWWNYNATPPILI